MSSKSSKKVVRSVPKKKKKSCCCKCVTTLFLIFVIILGVGTGVGWYFGDQYTQANFDMKMSDILGVLRDVTSVKEKNLVTNSYSGTTANAFENKLKKQLFLNEDVQIDKARIMEMVLGDKEPAEDEENTDPKNTANYTTRSYLTTILQNEDGGEGSGTESNPLIDMISELLVPENMDFSELENYEAENHSDYLLEINDKEIAKFLSDCLGLAFENEELIESLDLPFKLTATEMKELIRIDQLIFGGTESAPSIKLTLSVGTRLALMKFANQMIEENVSQLSKYNLGKYLSVIAPKRLYLTAEVLLSEEPELNLFINNMDQEKMDRFYKLLKGIGDVAGEEIDVKKMVDDAIGDVLKTVGGTLHEFADFSKLSSGTLKVDLFDVVLKMTGINNDEDGNVKDDPLTSSDLLLTLKYLLTSDPDFNNYKNKTPYSWMNQYEIDGSEETQYSAAPIDGKDPIDYKNEFLLEMSNKLMINLDGADGVSGTDDDITFEKLMELLGISGEGGGGTDNLMDLVDMSKLEELANDDTIDTRVIITDRMLGAIFNSQIGSLMSDGGGSLDGMELTLYYVSITVDQFEGTNRQFMEAAIGIDTASLFGDIDGIGEIIGAIVPSKIVVGFKMEITVGVDEEYVYAPTTLDLNNLNATDADAVDTLLDVLGKLVPDFGFDGLTSQLEAPLRDALNKMSDQVPIAFETSSIVMADLFTIAVDMVINSDDDKVTYEDLSGNTVEFTGADLREVVKELFAEVIIDSSLEASDNQHAFLQEVIDKYYLKGYVVGAEPDGGAGTDIYIDTFDDLSSSFSMDTLDGDKLDMDALMTTDESNDELRPEISEGEVANIIKDKMAGDSSFGSFSDIKAFDIQVDEVNNTQIIEIIIRIDTNSLFGESGGDFEKFFSVDELFVKVTVDLKNTVVYDENKTAYSTTLTINNMDELQLRKTMALVNSFNKNASGLNLDDSARQIGYYMYDNIGDFEAKLGGNCEFTNTGIKIASIFDLIAGAQTDSNGNVADTEIVRESLQGLRVGGSRYNYSVGDIYTNEIEASVETGRKTAIATSLIGLNPNSLNLLDSEFGWMLVGELGSELDGKGVPRLTLSRGNDDADFDLVSYNIYTKNSSDPAFDRIYANDQSFPIVGYNEDSTYMEFVFLVKGLGVGGTGNKYANMLPEELYITILFVFDGHLDKFVVAQTSDEGGEENYLRINRLSKVAQDSLFDIAKINMTNIQNQLNNCATVFENDFFKGRAYDTEEKGESLFGTFYFPPATLP